MSTLLDFNGYSTPVSESSSKYDAAAAMLFFSYPEMAALHAEIDPADVYTQGGFGLEEHPHCSLLCGIDAGVRAQPVLEMIQQYPIPSLRLRNVSTFPPRAASPFEVLKFDIEGAGLREINQALAAHFPYSTPFAYHPHCTIAYLHKGAAAQYVKALAGVESSVVVEQIVYSRAGTGKMIRIYV